MTAVSVEPKATAPEETDEGIIDVYHERDPPFSANSLSFLMEFHKDHSAINLYDMTSENREIVELALRNAKAERLLVTNKSDSAIKVVYQANQEAKARGMPGYQPEQGKLEAKAPFSISDLEYLRRYFAVTLADTIFGLTTQERARASPRGGSRDLGPPKTKATTDDTPGTARPMAEGPGDLFFGHEAEDDSALGISDEDCEGILGMIEEKTLTSGGCEVNKEAGMGNKRKLNEVSMNIVLVLLSEFSAPRGHTNGLDNDVAEQQLDQRSKTKEELLAVAFNEVIPRDEPNKYRHLKPLYISAHVEGVPVSKVFVDYGATVNILPYSLMKKLDKSKEDLIPSDVVMSSFVGDESKTIGVFR
ncbi:unnamed protein product [Prunus armeniaca]